MKMRIPPRMPPKMKMMSRWTSCFFSFPFWHLMTKGEWKCHICTHLGMCRLCIELMSFPFRFELPRSCVRTMWCENICNVCYFVPRCVVYLCFKEVVLGWKFFPWLVTVFLCSGSEGPDTPGYMPDSPDSLTGVSGLLPGVSGSCWQTDFFKWIEWITCHLHHTCLALTCSPHCKTYKSFCGSLDIYAKIVDMSSQNWNSKFMAYF